ncbi:hypothetical protein JCM8547_003039 [Rhodosporidiobolus lusitaniae]
MRRRLSHSDEGPPSPTAPCLPYLDLDLQGDPNAAPTEAQIQYVGTTKAGKPRKVFLCKVPRCAKVFKRSEHLKRHVRSIHTNEKQTSRTRTDFVFSTFFLLFFTL